MEIGGAWLEPYLPASGNERRASERRRKKTAAEFAKQLREGTVFLVIPSLESPQSIGTDKKYQVKTTPEEVDG